MNNIDNFADNYCSIPENIVKFLIEKQMKRGDANGQLILSVPEVRRNVRR